MTGPWLRPTAAAAYLDMPYKSFDAWVRKHGVPCQWIGRHRRFSQPVLDRVLSMLTLRKQQLAHRSPSHPPNHFSAQPTNHTVSFPHVSVQRG